MSSVVYFSQVFALRLDRNISRSRGVQMLCERSFDGEESRLHVPQRESCEMDDGVIYSIPPVVQEAHEESDQQSADLNRNGLEHPRESREIREKALLAGPSQKS